MHPGDCLFSASWLDCMVAELWQVVPGFVGFFLKFPSSRRLGMDGKKQMAPAQVWAAMLDFYCISC